ncbi:hypothetical protein RDV89_00560 [Nocardioides zeae]|uniref:DUF222 domain-containing protein n=1 Tax=Nocardioides imazamoxiresistens TaxID=3231893 RepID=A0ABU3PRN4_9ACTN|nr:hypothetical protein [Nocardioides zeae]MDT9591537.1 hypothetical protein [Nocardioides zeae]
MSWTTFHRRGEVLAAVVEAANTRRDGLLPDDVPGVPETFRDELDLLGALQLRWHTRLSGRVERELSGQPLDLDDAVVRAWVATAGALPGVREVLDRALAVGVDPEADRLLATAVAKERMMLAAMAGRSSYDDDRAVAVGADVEERARAAWARVAGSAAARDAGADARPGLLDRLRAALAA